MTQPDDRQASRPEASTQTSTTISTKTPPIREYERSGFYPENGKAFRIWALLSWIAGTVVVLALISAGLNYILLKT